MEPADIYDMIDGREQAEIRNAERNLNALQRANHIRNIPGCAPEPYETYTRFMQWVKAEFPVRIDNMQALLRSGGLYTPPCVKPSVVLQHIKKGHVAVDEMIATHNAKLLREKDCAAL